ncbi:hypothetical protein BJ508DRAFT_301910 [Ascobolus immersus RN42]|uniref:Uncharacterized protein n=1 Tax=Ascobolus immersus RN42 TaxID=1160509 RepID=A0A3N4IMA7_ASCIM|nr:hypothetical protein BJ508DRAFT_301910 [Ascobolus immersus RN42]
MATGASSPEPLGSYTPNPFAGDFTPSATPSEYGDVPSPSPSPSPSHNTFPYSSPGYPNYGRRPNPGYGYNSGNELFSNAFSTNDDVKLRPGLHYSMSEFSIFRNHPVNRPTTPALSTPGNYGYTPLPTPLAPSVRPIPSEPSPPAPERTYPRTFNMFMAALAKEAADSMGQDAESRLRIQRELQHQCPCCFEDEVWDEMAKFAQWHEDEWNKKETQRIREEEDAIETGKVDPADAR